MSNKNRKSKLRKIVVDERIYFWNVSKPNCDGDGGCRFDIWKNKVKIYSGVTQEKNITPKNVSEKIKILIKNENTI